MTLTAVRVDPWRRSLSSSTVHRRGGHSNFWCKRHFFPEVCSQVGCRGEFLEVQGEAAKNPNHENIALPCLFFPSLIVIFDSVTLVICRFFRFFTPWDARPRFPTKNVHPSNSTQSHQGVSLLLFTLFRDRCSFEACQPTWSGR